MATTKTPEPKLYTVEGTGKDPLDRYPSGHLTQTSLTPDQLAELVDQGYLIDRSDDASIDAKAAAMAAVHTPEVDELGTERQSRRFTPEEAAAVDAENRRLAVVRRANRFKPDRRRVVRLTPEG